MRDAFEGFVEVLRKRGCGFGLVERMRASLTTISALASAVLLEAAKNG